MQTKPGTGMICYMIRPESVSRPKGTAMSRPEMTMPGTDMICEPEGMSRPVGTAIKAGHGRDLWHDPP
jgi:hypothetical protein